MTRAESIAALLRSLDAEHIVSHLMPTSILGFAILGFAARATIINRDRANSDARGMEAVENEARDIHARAPYVHGGFEWASRR